MGRAWHMHSSQDPVTTNGTAVPPGQGEQTRYSVALSFKTNLRTSLNTLWVLCPRASPVGPMVKILPMM